MTYTPGDNYIICDISGRKVLMSKSKKTWDGLRVHPDYWYPRHPQLDVKGRPDKLSVVDGRGRTEDRFIEGGCSIYDKVVFDQCKYNCPDELSSEDL